MKTILNESGHERNRNAGDEAYFATMVQMFRESFGDIHIMSFSDRPERDRERYSVETVYSGGTFIMTLASLYKIVRAILKCDVYVWGAGQILRDDTGFKSPLYRLSRPLLARMLGKPVMAYASGIGPLETKGARFLAKHVLNTFNVITVREPFSKKLIERLGVTKPEIQLTVDPAFGLKIAPPAQVDQTLEDIGVKNDAPLVGIAPFGPAFRGVKSLLSAKLQVKLDMWKPGGKEKYHRHIQAMAKACDYIVDKYMTKLIFIAQDASWQGLDDKISADIITLMKNQNSVTSLNSDDIPPAVMKGITGRMEFVMGGRMHTLILACSACTPVLGTCFEQKIKSFGLLIGQQEYFIDMREITETERLLSVIDGVWSHRQKIKRKLDLKMKQFRQMAESNVSLLGKILKLP